MAPPVMTPPQPSRNIEWLGLAGPTAAGKTALALTLAAHWPMEIISVDSALVYRGMDIGTAKPSAAERDQVTHHLLDLLAPEERYSAAQFVTDAKRLVHEIRGRGRWPLLVGGTMMYFNALIQGMDSMPGANAQLRATIEVEATERGWPALHSELARIDPETAARLAPNDSQRIQRALEVFRLSGVPLSVLHQRAARRAAINPGGRLLTLEPNSRAWLHERIDQRFQAMLESGFLDEVRTLRRRPNLHATQASMRCVGYRQAWEALDASDPPDLTHLRERSVAATRQLAKRQLTWLRHMTERQAVAADEPDVEERLLHTAQRLLGAPGSLPRTLTG